ncbi:restriction endonuclease [Thauera aminoaromatica]|uniref:Endonuclease n=1 Tax=Thauera aminoaromatica TaxID=164330 RepID=A0A5C7SP81_THASP|nr:restriction endonuclease [Thauera aminoaromatica]TXH84715.1 MAG: endonuclease [Thauera aminoaromatica]
MSRRYRRSRREPGLIEIAATSDWKVAAGMSAVGVLASVVVIPALFGGSRVLGALVPMLSPLAALIAAVFGVIALVRFVTQQRQAPSPGTSRSSPVQRREPTTGVTPPPLTDLDKALLSGASVPPPNRPREERPTAWSREVIDRIEWKRFEDLCCEFYRVKGIRAETTRLGADGGVDIRLFQDDAAPQRCTAVVQCKAWNQAVGVKPVRELRGVMAHEKVEKAFFMAPNGFTDDAKAFAGENRITLLDGRLFLAMVERLPETQRQPLLAFATAGDWTTPTCPSCGMKMTARDSKRGRFWGCLSYPRCRGMLPMRATAG